MEKYVINGFEVEYDTFDLGSMEKLEKAVKKVVENSTTAEEAAADRINENELDTIRRICEAMLRFFDEVLGEGAARELFGDRVNFRVIMEAYRKFNEDVKANTREAVQALTGKESVYENAGKAAVNFRKLP